MFEAARVICHTGSVLCGRCGWQIRNHAIEPLVHRVDQGRPVKGRVDGTNLNTESFQFESETRREDIGGVLGSVVGSEPHGRLRLAGHAGYIEDTSLFMRR